MPSELYMRYRIALARVHEFFQNIFLELAGLPVMRRGFHCGIDEEKTVAEVRRVFAACRKKGVYVEKVQIGPDVAIWSYFKIKKVG